MTTFDINVYWNVMSNTSVASSSTFKLFMLISDFATFWLFEKFKIDIRMRSQNVKWFKQIVQQALKKLNFEKSRIISSSDQFMKNWKKNDRRRNCLFEMIVRTDYLISWRLFIMIKEQSLTEKRTCVTRWILLFLCYSCYFYTGLIFHSKVSYILQLL